MVSASDGSAFTGSVTVSVTGDAGTQATGSVGSGACTHEGNGYHTYAPAQAETNYDLIAFTFTGTGAIPATVQVFTNFPQTVDNATNISAIKTKTDSLTFTVANVLDANTLRIGGTTQTARDIGASVLLSSGTGTGQLDFTSGVVKANLAQILGTALTETAGQIAAGFKQFFNIGSPTSTMNTITAVTTTTTATNVTTVNGLANNVITAASINASALNGKGDWNIGKTGYSLSSAGVQAIWDALTSALTTASSIGKLLVDNINATISSRLASASYTAPLDAAGTRSAVGLASANLDTQLTAIDDYLDTEIAAIKAKTDNLPASPAATGDAMTLTSAYDFAKGTVAMTESYAAQGATMTPVQALYQINQHLGESSISSTTKTVKKRDGSTSAKTFTLNDATTPTAITEAT